MIRVKLFKFGKLDSVRIRPMRAITNLTLLSFILINFNVVSLLAQNTTSPRKLTNNDIMKIVNRLLHERLPYNSEDVIIEYRRIPEGITIPHGDAKFVEIPANYVNYRGNVVFQLGIYLDGKLHKRVPLSLKIRTFENVLIVARRINRHQLIQSSSFNIEKRETTVLPNDILKSADSVVGTRATRILNPGRIIQASMIEYPPVIERGRAVALVVRIGNIMVATPAKAMEDGNLNELITVHNLKSKKRVVAKVINSNTVVVEP